MVGAHRSGTNASAKAPYPDDLSAFAALRGSDGALTVMVIGKVERRHGAASGTAQVYRLTASNSIQHLADLPWSGGVLNDTEPAQSITLYVLPQ